MNAAPDQHNDVPQPVPGACRDGRRTPTRIGEAAIKHTMAHARNDIDIEYRAVQQRHAFELATATATAARLSASYVAVKTGQDVSVSLDYPEGWSGLGLQVHGDTSHGLGLEAWLRAMELAPIVGDEAGLDRRRCR